MPDIPPFADTVNVYPKDNFSVGEFLIQSKISVLISLQQ